MSIWEGDVQSSVQRRDFALVAGLMKEHFGIALTPSKDKLVAARLLKETRELKLDSVNDYVEYLLHDSSGVRLSEMADALTTNCTSFFREAEHFRILSDAVGRVFPKVDNLRLWSAGCSSGEEPYSMAFTLLGLESPPRFTILASDISRRALQAAERAVYSKQQVATVEPQRLRKFFQRGRGDCEGLYKVKPPVQQTVDLRRINLAEATFPVGPFHFIFCRNVMIYFDREMKQQLLRRFASCLEPGGYLFTGHSEGFAGISHDFEYVMPAVYRVRTEARTNARRGC